MPQCACGCSERVGFTKWRISRRAVRIRRLVAEMRLLEQAIRANAYETSPSAHEAAEELDSFSNEGDTYANELIQVAHGEQRPQDMWVDHRQISQWESSTVKLKLGFYQYAGVSPKEIHKAAAEQDSRP